LPTALSGGVGCCGKKGKENYSNLAAAKQCSCLLLLSKFTFCHAAIACIASLSLSLSAILRFFQEFLFVAKVAIITGKI
jgi:hypothetical protein